MNSEIKEFKKELRNALNGVETTLEAKTELNKKEAIKAIAKMLKATNSLFHFDSKQFKAIKAGLNKLRDGNATEADMIDLKANVRNWLTDPDYDRINKHSRNNFDNTRFNIMFTLANELDPAWAKEKFPDMNIAGLHGEKAADSSFHNVHDFSNFMHKRIAEHDFLANAGDIRTMRWFHKPDKSGQSGLVEEAMRAERDAAFSEKERLDIAQKNITKLLGISKSKVVNHEPPLDKLKAYSDEITFYRNNEQHVTTEKYAAMKETLKNKKTETLYAIEQHLKNAGEDEIGTLQYKKAVLAFALLDPKKAQNYIQELQEKKKDLKDIKTLNLVELERAEGLDLGGRKALREKKKKMNDTKPKKSNSLG